MKNVYYKLAALILIIGIPVYYFMLHELSKEPLMPGDKYLYSYDWESENPFENIKVDTVTIMAINGYYIQWETKDGIKLSGKIKYFSRNIRPIK
jgi:hypothetical protein